MLSSQTQKLEPIITLTEILRVLSSQRNLLVFRLIASEKIVDREIIRKKLNMKRSNQSKSLSDLLKVDLIRRKPGAYCLTSIGKIVLYLETEVENIVSLYHRLRVVDAIDDFPDDHRNEIISRIVDDPHVKEILLKDSRALKSHIHTKLDENGVNNKEHNLLRRNVVIIDDEPDLTYTFQSILLEEGHNVYGFSDPYKALNSILDLYASKGKIDLLIVDIRMPRLNGLQVYKTLKAIDENIRTLFVSALSEADELLRIYPGDDNFELLKKPVDRDSLIKEVRRLLLLNPV
jgi:CheY-like chemotaxis protein/predicted transcriptional regulator